MATTKKPLNKRKQASKKTVVKKAVNSSEQIKLKKELFLKECEINLAFINKSAKAAGIGTTTVYKWFEEDPEFKAKYDEIFESRKEFVEGALYEQIKKGNVTAILFCLKSKFGYQEIQRVDANVLQNIQILNCDPIADNEKKNETEDK